jgi:hypothetical protein
VLPEDVRNWVTEVVHVRCAEHNPVTYAELLDGLEYDHGIIMSGDSLRHIVRSMTMLKSVVGIPKDSERPAVDAPEIDALYDILAEKLLGVSCKILFKVKDTGCSEHFESHEAKVVVAIDYLDPSIPVLVTARLSDRRPRHASLPTDIG